MKYQLIEIGRSKVTRSVEVKNDRELLREVRKHLMSGDVDIDWNGQTGSVIVGGMRKVGEVLRIQ